MGSLQTKQRSAIAVVLGVVLALTGLVGPAEAATARKATLGISPTTQLVGSPVTLAGNVSKSGKGAVVKIQRRSGSSWVAAGQTKTTTAAGKYSVKLSLPATAGVYSYRVLAPKKSKFRSALSPVRTVTALRKTTATILGATPASIPLGSTSDLNGKVTPFTPNAVVVIQKLASGNWVTETTTTLKSDGTFIANVEPTVTTTYRAYVPRNGLNAVATSGQRIVNVGPAQTSPNITSPATLPEGDKGIAYPALTLTKTGGAGTWSVTSGALPAGITLNGATGVLSGTPTAGGTTNFTIKFKETSTNLTDSQAFTLVVTPPPTITTTALTDVTRGELYSATLTKNGKPGTWSLVAGNSLPAGLTLNPATGLISGTTTAAAATYPVYPIFTETSTGRATPPRALSLKLVNAPAPGSPSITTSSLTNADKDVAYSSQLAKSGGAGTWAINSGTPPAGITLSPAGLLAGTPTVAGSKTFEVKFTETSSGVVALKTLTLLVTPLPVITTTALTDVIRGEAYSMQLIAEGKPGTWSLVANPGPPPVPPLPAGLTLNPATGVISGTTNAAAAVYPVYPVFTETGTGRQVAASLSLKIVEPDTSGPVAITTTTLTDADKGVAYTATLTKTPTAAVGVWTIFSGSLPAGITLAPATGVLSGTPTAGGSTASFEVKFTRNGTNESAVKALTLLVTPPPTITTTSLPDATRNVAYAGATLEKTGKPGTWSLVQDTSLPAGLTLSPAGVISGTATGPAGTFAVYPVFTETSTGRKVGAALSLKVGPADPVITTTTIPTGIRDAAYSKQLEKTGATGTWTLKTGTLPAGVTLSLTGLLAGTPTDLGDYGFTVTFTETATGFFDNQVYLLHVEVAGSPQITSPAVLPDGTMGTAYNYTLDGDGTGTWETGIFGILPPGISLNAATGALTGTPTVKGDYLFILKYTTATGANTKLFSIHVNDTP